MSAHRKPWANLAQTDEFDPRPSPGDSMSAAHRADSRADQLAAICASPTALAHLQDVLSARAFEPVPPVHAFGRDDADEFVGGVV